MQGISAVEKTAAISGAHKTLLLFMVIGPLVGFVAAVILTWNWGVDLTSLCLLIGFFLGSLIGIGAGFHRLFSHPGYDAHPAVACILALLGSSSVEGSVLWWCCEHRVHHAESDKKGDPHSPHHHGSGMLGTIRGLWHAHIGWLFDANNSDREKFVPDLLENKMLVTVDRLFPLLTVVSFLLPAVLGGLITLSWKGALLGFLWGGPVRIFLFHHVTWSTNSICHMFGSRPYKSRDESRNNIIFGIIGGGEGWHNNHHAFPASPRHGLAWWQFDFNWLVIRTLALLGLAHDLRLPSKEALAAKRA